MILSDAKQDCLSRFGTPQRLGTPVTSCMQEGSIVHSMKKTITERASCEKTCCATTMRGCQLYAQGPAAKPMPLMMMTWFRERMMTVESGHPAGCPTSSGTARSNLAIRDSRRIRTCTSVTPLLSGDDKRLVISGMLQVSNCLPG